MTTTAETPSPALHGYTDERGVWEDTTFWSPTWATYTGNMTSKLSDLRTWASAVGTGSLLSKRSHARQIAPKTAGLGRLTKAFFYGLGVAVANKWVLSGAPGLLGYTGIVAYLPGTIRGRIGRCPCHATGGAVRRRTGRPDVVAGVIRSRSGTMRSSLRVRR